MMTDDSPKDLQVLDSAVVAGSDCTDSNAVPEHIDEKYTPKSHSSALKRKYHNYETDGVVGHQEDILAKASRHDPVKLQTAPPQQPSESTGLLDEYLGAKKDRTQRLENLLRNAIEESAYANISQILDELLEVHHHDDLDIVLRLTEYEILRENEDSSVETAASFILNSGPRSLQDLIKTGFSLIQQGHHLRAIILSKVTHAIYKKTTTSGPDDEINWIRDRITDINCAIEYLIDSTSKSRGISKRYGIKYLTEMLEEARAVTGASLHAQALTELNCLSNIAGIYEEFCEYETSIRIAEEGVTMTKKQFEGIASNYKVYGLLLNNLGKAYDHIGQYSNAGQCYVTALQVKESALDYESEEKKRESIEMTKANLRGCRKDLERLAKQALPARPEVSE